MESVLPDAPKNAILTENSNITKTLIYDYSMTHHSARNMKEMQQLIENNIAQNGNIITVTYPDGRRYKVGTNGNYEPILNAPVMRYNSTRKSRSIPPSVRGSLKNFRLLHAMNKLNVTKSKLSSRIRSIRNRILSKHKSRRCNHTIKTLSRLHTTVEKAHVGDIICIRSTPISYYKVISKQGKQYGIQVHP